MDVTSAAGEICWEKVRAAGMDFAMIRAGRGQTRDVRFGENLAGADRVGMAAGFSPMLCAPPELVRSLPDIGRAFPLWLLSWNVPEYRAMQFCPRIWQYDSGFADGVTVRIPRNRGYFGSRMPDVRRIT